MENKINIAELLKDCPKGMELDCTTWENVTFEKVMDNKIFIRRNNKQPNFDNLVVLNEYGCATNHKDEKCRIFPKGKITWEGFQSQRRPFKEGDIVTCKFGTGFVFMILSKFVNFVEIHYYCAYDSVKGFVTNDYIVGNLSYVSHATEEEKQKLFDAIKENSYSWNAETKTLEKLCPLSEIEPYKEEETMEEKGDKAPNLIGKDYYGKKFGYKIPNGYEFDCIINNEIILKPKYFEYPTTYKECCDVLHINTMDNDAQGYEADLIIRFQELLIARNAYWKIAGEQLGLGKSWEPDWENKEETKYCITTINNQVSILTTDVFNYILSFPTREICSAFLNNFNLPIDRCKKLL